MLPKERRSPSSATFANVASTCAPHRIERMGVKLLWALACSALALWWAAGAAAQPATTTPNVLFIVYDDLDFYGDLQPYSDFTLDFNTPFSDILASEGKKLDHFYANAGICSPSRIGFSTGLYPTQLGFSYVTGDASLRGIPADEPTLARLFKGMGYRTAAFGKWHAGKNSADNLPSGVGFDESVIDCTYLNIGVPDATYGDTYDNAQFCDAPGQVLPDSGATYATTYTVDKTLEFIADALDSPAGQPPGPGAEPFFAQIWLHAPHTPLTCPPGATCPSCDATVPSCESSQPGANCCTYLEFRDIYEQIIQHAEEQLSRIQEDLHDRQLWDDHTLVILTSDNGGVGAWQEPFSPLLGRKGGVLERSVRVPFLMSGPGIETGNVSEEIMGHDLLSTLADYFDQPLPGYRGSGESFAGLIWDDGTPWNGDERPLFWELRPFSSAGNHALFYPWQRHAVQKTVQGQRWKLVQQDLSGGGAIPRLFQLSTSETESLGNDRTFVNSTVRHHLLDELSTWRVRDTAFFPEVDYLDGAVAQNGDAFTFSTPGGGQAGGAVFLQDHPILTVDEQDLSVSFTFTPTQVGAHARLIERHNSWWVMLLADNRPAFFVRQNGGGTLWVASKVQVQAGQTYRITAVVEGTRGLSLYVDDVLDRVRAKVLPVPNTAFPVVLGRQQGGGQPFIGTLEDLVIHPIVLRTEDLELDGLFSTGFENGDPMPFAGSIHGTIAVEASAAYRGGFGLRHTAQVITSPGDLGDAYTTPYVGAAASVLDDGDNLELQLSAWVKGDGGVEDWVSLYIFCMDANGGISWDPRAFSYSRHLAVDDWLRVTHRHQCPAGTEDVSIRLDNDSQDSTVFWDEVKLGRVSRSYFSTGFENEGGATVQSVFAADSLPVAAEGKTGSQSMRLAAGTETSMHVLPYGGSNHFITSLWAKSTGGGNPRLSIWFYCLDNQGNAIDVPTGNCPTDAYPHSSNPPQLNQACMRSYAGFPQGDWQKYELWGSCPASPPFNGANWTSKVGIRLETGTGGADLLVDDLTLSITSVP